MPFGYRRVSYLEYRTVTKYYTPEEAYALAVDELSKTVAYELDGAEILSTDVRVESGDTSLTVTYEIVAIENIALTKEFEIQYKK